ncbi:Hypothetical protein PP7435_CHR1-1568 [Komagataella phaffii CBS 7435]|uniref:Uncharacterized protein n=2 Tax=Komagataella phaffii TaxID=460519 RepID=C4R9E5_KOMPG|nr:GQ67_01373T0 [Komagataella phaffii]AOA65997.1 GQ68_01389T0 [Komagataella phaffii GS115]CAH2447450.1 Hypothetical protein BQ9382_C1-8190 [Komagataella phaffii CBS 7435]CAY67040.1 hypothetical protein PAS_c034_0023 [Komagataella pastoris]CCA37679.1 Hypothetical protein PP7435_CHR1-1568 [Komagataella phaffii CBS 7435]
MEIGFKGLITFSVNCVARMDCPTNSNECHLLSTDPIKNRKPRRKSRLTGILFTVEATDLHAADAYTQFFFLFKTKAPSPIVKLGAGFVMTQFSTIFLFSGEAQMAFYGSTTRLLYLSYDESRGTTAALAIEFCRNNHENEICIHHNISGEPFAINIT